jgi:hypothetical protein
MPIFGWWRDKNKDSYNLIECNAPHRKGVKYYIQKYFIFGIYVKK